MARVKYSKLLAAIQTDSSYLNFNYARDSLRSHCTIVYGSWNSCIYRSILFTFRRLYGLFLRLWVQPAPSGKSRPHGNIIVNRTRTW